MLATHMDAEQRYDVLRREALQIAVETLRTQDIDNIQLSAITVEALNLSRRWSLSNARKVDWDWQEGYRIFRFRYPKRFELAIWEHNRLIGLSMGRPTYHNQHMRLDVVEAAPADLGQREGIFETVLLAYGIYARLINARQIRIMHSLNEQVRTYYESFGYKYVQNGDYLYAEVD
ncbi:hypothetical protein [Microbulbifer litoralis]|uniref:hypothetical protein n=1 Tax=Microbulbifer litoralis TaxID=2933965 RepID=UPI0020277F15|nr:hypothetical protein [Microbulbifer sp. GX H0434]